MRDVVSGDSGSSCPDPGFRLTPPFQLLGESVRFESLRLSNKIFFFFLGKKDKLVWVQKKLVLDMVSFGCAKAPEVQWQPRCVPGSPPPAAPIASWGLRCVPGRAGSEASDCTVQERKGEGRVMFLDSPRLTASALRSPACGFRGQSVSCLSLGPWGNVSPISRSRNRIHPQTLSPVSDAHEPAQKVEVF